jgi:class 3 adenylate cyclase
LRCAHEIRQDAPGEGLAVRAGLHSGEIVLRDGNPVGVAVHAAARIAALARSGEVLLSDTVLALSAGSGTECEPAGEHQLKGIPGSWRLHRLIRPGG